MDILSIDKIPNKVMLAIAYDTSFFFAPITGAVAIIAVVPHTVLPIDIK
jgi:hypothetical protein